MFRTIRDVYATHGLEKTARFGTEYVLLRSSLASPLSKRVYWMIAPAYYRHQYATDFQNRPTTPDPFKIEPVSPAAIQRFTRRCYPPWWNRRELFGSVKGGDWDRRSREETPTFSGPPEYLFTAESFEESLLYRALKAHFDNGVPWTETRFITEVISLLRDGEEFVWHECRSREDVLERCEHLDRVYESMRREGCLGYRERTEPRERDGDFIDAMEREIIVDIGRDGELLLVSGKHRLCLAQLLNLDEVPVAFLVRHTEWMDRRRSRRDGTEFDGSHPDVPSPAEQSPENRRGVAK